ncbi:MAG: ATP synthase F1 subunit gamma [Ruminococcus sp.]|nr:ATP synthase F1 subunit gamma [Ruminococcus sp.]
MATANIKDVKRRIKSVESTMQITKAMELVASSKLRKAKENAIQAQPYFKTLYETLKNISLNSSGTVKNDSVAEKKALLVVIAGDRGLAGGFNHNVLKLAQERIDSLLNDGFAISVMPIGKKSIEYFSKRSYDIYDQRAQFAENASVYDCLDISDDVVSKYTRGELARVEICYTTFANTLSQIAKNVTAFPFEVTQEQKPDETEEQADTKRKYKASVIYDPSPEEVLKLLLPKYFGGLLYGAVVDSYASEQAARRTAMEAASDNAQEMIDNLSLLYNRARQAQITQELTEIVSGSMKNSD